MIQLKIMGEGHFLFIVVTWKKNNWKNLNHFMFPH
jgi:hypothetical protein